MKAGKKGIRGVVLFLLSFCGILLVFFSLRPLPERVTEQSLKTEQQGVTLLGSRYEGWEGTAKIWAMEAAEIFRTADGRRITFRGVKNIVFWPENGQPFTLKADKGFLDLKVNLLTLKEISGDLNGGELLTREMEIDLDKKEINCPQLLTFKKEGLALQANRMAGNFETGEYQFSGDLEVIQKDQRLRGRIFTYYAKEDRFQIQGEVEVELDL